MSTHQSHQTLIPALTELHGQLGTHQCRRYAQLLYGSPLVTSNPTLSAQILTLWALITANKLTDVCALVLMGQMVYLMGQNFFQGQMVSKRMHIYQSSQVKFKAQQTTEAVHFILKNVTS